MAHNLEGARLKAGHARKHLQTLVASIDAFGRSNIHQVNAGPGVTPDAVRLSAHRTAPLPSEWPLIVGDIAHNARSALDYLVYSLSALSDTDSVRERMRFPVVSNAQDFAEFTSDYGINTAHLSMLEKCQPYSGSLPSYDHPFAILHEINRIDKHRMLHLIAGESRLVRLAVESGSAHPLAVIEHGDRVAAATANLSFVGDGVLGTEPSPILDVMMYAKASPGAAVRVGLVFDVTFDGPSLIRKRQLKGTLTDIVQSVDNAIAMF